MKALFSRLAGHNKQYTAHINTSAGVVTGLVRVQLETRDARLLHTPVDFSVEIIGAKTRTAITKCVTPGEAHTSWIAFHSHLLENGPYTIRWRAAAVNGRVSIRVRNSGELASHVASQLRGTQVSLFLTEPCDSALYENASDRLQPWYDQPNCHALLDELLDRGRVPAELESSFRQFLDEGWFEIENHLDDRLIKRLNAAMDHAAQTGDSGFTPGSSQRLQRMHVKYDSFWDVTTYQKTQQIIDTLMQTPSTACQVIGFINGTQQAPHQDAIHLSVFPQGYMCGAWVALEDVQPDSGELVIYPGSHRWDLVMMKDAGIDKVSHGRWSEFANTVEVRWQKLVDQSGAEPMVYRPKRGSLLVWHERLMHGGSRRLNKSLTRKSCVTHHFAQGGIIYYDSSGLPGRVIERDAKKKLISRKTVRQLISHLRRAESRVVSNKPTR